MHPSGLSAKVVLFNMALAFLLAQRTFLATRREWLPIAALSHLTEDTVTCDNTTPLPRLSSLGVLALLFESRLELSFHPCPTGCTSWFGNSQEENTSVTMLTRTKLSVIHYTF